MKLSPFDTENVARGLARTATLDVGDAIGGLPSRTEDRIEHLLTSEFQRVLGRLEVCDGHAYLLTDDEGPVVLTHPEPVTH